MSPDVLTICFVCNGTGLSLPTFSLMVEMVSSLRVNMQMISGYGFNYIGWILPQVQDYFKCLDLPQLPDTSCHGTLERLATGFDVRGKDITFCYPNQSDQGEKKSAPPHLALQNLTFHFETGKMHALVGDNGCGKTTLVQLISQLYPTYSGTMTINGKDIKTYNIKEIRKHMSVMFQDIAKAPLLSVAENIGIGDISAISN